ncbi:MAG: transglutaminase-like cysteine peptidase [Rhizomicrobium sp.]
MGRVLARLAVVVLFASFVSGCATSVSNVGSIPPIPPLFSPPAASSFPPTAAVISSSSVAAAVPPGFISFCIRFPDQCQAPQGAPATITLTSDAWRKLEQVNSAVNASIWPEDDQSHYGRAEYWTIPTDGYGNCHDYALTKRKQLIDAGFPEPALRIAIVITPREERHAVLTVATDKGDYVLDNLNGDVVAWNATGYTWIERQDPTRPLGWVSLQPSMIVAANDEHTVASITPPAQPMSSTSIRE